MEEARKNSFTYEEQLSEGQIRVLKIRPGKDDELIECELTVSPLSASYKAISYAWGDPTPSHHIICNGKNLLITSNLHAAFWQFRENEEFGALWADAVSINQANLAEKSQQVRNMRQVYQNAATVLIWLGVKEEKDGPGLKLLWKIDLIFRREFSSVKEAEWVKSVEALGLPKVGLGSPWTSLCGLYRSWFSRVWVVQELLSAKTWEFHLGKKRISSSAYFQVAIVLCSKELCLRQALGRSMDREYFSHQTHVEAANLAELKRCEGEHNQTWSWEKKLASLLRLTAGLQATDPRDKIFALVGLVVGAPPVIIDYELDLTSILTQLAKLLTVRVSIFVLLGYVHCQSTIPGLPSWVNDWSQGSTPGFSPACDSFNIDPWSLCAGPPEPSLSNGTILSIHGRLVDEVGETITRRLFLDTVWTTAGETRPLETNQVTYDFVTGALNVSHCSRLYKDRQIQEESCWRALTFGHVVIEELTLSATGASWLEMLRMSKYIHLLTSRGVPVSEVALLYDQESPASSWRRPIGESDNIVAKSMEAHAKESAEQAANFSPYHESMERGATGRHFFRSERGYLGWVPKHSRQGDRICVFQGCQIPWVIRPREEGDGFTFIGACYMQGLMNGEAFELARTEAASINLV